MLPTKKITEDDKHVSLVYSIFIHRCIQTTDDFNEASISWLDDVHSAARPGRLNRCVRDVQK